MSILHGTLASKQVGVKITRNKEVVKKAPALNWNAPILPHHGGSSW